MSPDTGIEAYAGLGADVNKLKGTTTPDTQVGVVSEKLPELTLDMPDEDIVKLTSKWKKVWEESPVKAEWEKQVEKNEKYWLGKQYEGPQPIKDQPSVDNLIFESLETYLPQMTRRNPEPLVELDAQEEETPESTAFATQVKERLADLSDKNKIRLKLKKAGRHWAIFHIGVAKFGWDMDKDMPIVRIIRPKKIILDPDAPIDEDGYTGNRIGEYRKMEASKLIALIKDNPDSAKAIEFIKAKVKDDLATDVQFIEWWTREYMCWTLEKQVLLKRKNPHWNYDSTEPVVSVDDFGNETQIEQEKPGVNHFPVPDMPYRFLTVFNLGDQPMDKTGLISQSLSNQDLINRRNKQMDKNIDSMNGGMVVSLERSGLTQSQAKGVTDALAKGGTIAIPSGSVRDAIDRYTAPGLPADVYNQLADTRARLRDIFGVKGSSQAGLADEQTVRGKIVSRSLDTDRIGGGVSEYLEQFADDMYNWLVQLLYVYDPAFQGITPPKITVSVKEGSLLPKDSMTIANQAIELAGMNRLSTLDLFKRLEYPNAEELAANVWLEANAPQLLYQNNPLVQQALQMQQEAAQVAAEEKMMMSATKHQNEMEKETMKADLKSRPLMQETDDMALSSVPTN